ncbi:Uncharacterised protein [[Clostridium] sordellii]|nr:Uncharacterised protein [[Clostridium] sordellii] [Paeniclostridium sordellii]
MNKKMSKIKRLSVTGTAIAVVSVGILSTVVNAEALT